MMIPQQKQYQQHNRYPPRNEPRPRNNYERMPPRVDSMPMSYNQILPYLIRKGWVELKALAPMIPPYPPKFDENARCGYNDGSLGHTIDNCNALKYKVQELIDAKLLTFKELDQNMKNNPLPGHLGPYINSIKEFVEIDMIKEVKKVKTHMLVIHEKLTKAMIIQ